MDTLDALIKLAYKNNSSILISVAADEVEEETGSEGNIKAAKIFGGYVALLRALYLLHQQNHWETRTHANHLLFQRLYEDVAGDVDEAAEKAVGLFGHLQDKTQVGKWLDKFSVEKHTSTVQEFLESSLAAEKAFQQCAQVTYDSLEEMDAMTLGLDDLIMSHASSGETRIYLLKQALGIY